MTEKPTESQFTRTPEFLLIQCTQGHVRIDIKTGAVGYVGLSVDQAARQFWQAVGRLVPAAFTSAEYSIRL